MKKTLIFIIAFSLLCSTFSLGTAFADGTVIVWEDNFDAEGDDFSGWQISKKCVTARSDKFAVSGKAMYMNDDSLELGITNYSPKFDVEPGVLYTVSADMISVSESNLKLYIRFYDANDKQLASFEKGMSESEWTNVTITGTSPAGSVYARVLTAIGKAAITEGAIDNIKVIKGVIWTKKSVLKNLPVQSAAVDAQLVKPEGDKLIYNTYNEKGDKISDFSKTGFYQGKYELPDSANLPLAATIEPSSDPSTDDTARIQKVIDETYNNSANNYFKVIKLKAGRYNINSKGLDLKTGIVLSGEGQGPDGTVLYATDKKQYTVLDVSGLSPAEAGSKHYIADDYVEAGSCEISLSEEDVKNYKAGDLITIYHDSVEKWSDAMGMKGIINVYDDDTTWKPGDAAMKMERTVVAVNGNTLTLDMPMYVPLMKEYSPAYIYKTNDSGRKIHIGIENLRIESSFNGSQTDEEHANYAISFQNAKDCYVRDVSCKYFIASAIICRTGAKQITAKNCSSLEPVSLISGSRRYSFMADRGSQQILYSGCYSFYARHDYVTSRPATGPVVFTDSIADYTESASETHGTWSTGVLYDNILLVGDSSGLMAAGNRVINGTAVSQGWSGAGVVFWNCLAPTIVAAKPPLYYQNFIIGQWGLYTGEARDKNIENNISNQKRIYRTSRENEAPEGMLVAEAGTSFLGNSYKESKTAPVEPRSLYKAQLSERLTGSFKNTKPNAPAITAPRGEKEYLITDNNVVIEGFYQAGAEKVTLYVDNQPYEAVLNSADNSFKLNIKLEDGTHKVYATQTIGGVESTKCADRFLIVNKTNGNPEYLQSQYDYNKLHPLINDSTVSFDVYQAEMLAKAEDKITVQINGLGLVSDVDPIEINGRVLVPMRAIFEAFGADVEWDEKTFTATAKTNSTTIKITENSTTVYVNDAPVILDVPATIINGRFLVPVRFISESFMAKVDWIDSKKLVSIRRNTAIADNLKLVPAYDAKWSHASADNKTGEQAIDGDNESRWAGNGKGVWMTAEFPVLTKISSFKTLFGSPEERTYNFEIHFSKDGVNYEKAFEGTSSLTADGDVFTLSAPVEAKFFKFIGQGGSNTDWILLHEIEFYKE